MSRRPTPETVLKRVEEGRDELFSFACELIRIPSENPPGRHYEDCARLIGEQLSRMGMEVEYHRAVDHPSHNRQYPRVNVVGKREGLSSQPGLHLNGHFDVVPAGPGWSLDPYAAALKGGRLYGRGSSDMKAGLAAAIFAAQAVYRAGAVLGRNLSISGSVDEESGGGAGVAWLAEKGILSRENTRWVIIPEPFHSDRICLGHRGVYWFKVTSLGRTAHGSMPFLGVNAIDGMALFLQALSRRLVPSWKGRRTQMPIVPEASRGPTLNTNSIRGGQPGDGPQTPCVAPECEAIFERRFLIEEGFDKAKGEIVDLIQELSQGESPYEYQLDDLMLAHPVYTAPESRLVRSLSRHISRVLGREAHLVASPGTYDHKHVSGIAGIEQCVAYGPGTLEQAHQPDEWCSLDELMQSTRVMALTILELTSREDRGVKRG